MATIDDVMDKLDDVLEKVAENKEKINEVRADVNIPKSLQRFCRHCHGTGNKTSGTPPYELYPCPDCGGNGLRGIAKITLTSEA